MFFQVFVLFDLGGFDLDMIQCGLGGIKAVMFPFFSVSTNRINVPQI